MPFVSSNFRRSTGAASGEAASHARRLDVAIYDEDGTNLLRTATGGRWGAKNLSFSSTLPGGFAAASFRLERPTARNWPGRAGLKVIVRRGNKILWYGWIEDLRRVVRGAVEAIEVTCLGPYQQVQQRTCTVAYSDTIDGSEALAAELAANCPSISDDYDDIAMTDVDLNALAWDNKPIADLVKLVCDTGNDSGQPMLFAVWEASYVGTPYSNVTNPKFSNSFTGWSTTTAAGTLWYAQNYIYHTSPRSAQAFRLSAGGLSTIYQTVAVSASSTYQIEYWAQFTTSGGVTASVYWTAAWKNSGGGTISTTTGTTRSSTASTSWTRYTEAANSPVGAVSCVLTFNVTVPNVVLGSVYLDDIYMYTSQITDTLPKAYLWARDLSTWDYKLYTAQLESGLNIDTTTRELANYVLASYDASSFTAAGQDATSQGLYRRRDAVVAAGSTASSGVATAMRDTYLALHKDPANEPGSFRLSRPGALRTAHGAPIHPEDVRAGDRIKIADGPLAGTIVLLKAVEYSEGVVTCTPERRADVPQLLAKS